MRGDPSIALPFPHQLTYQQPPCKECKGTGRLIWVASAARPDFYKMEQSGFSSLTLCQDCGRLWVASPYELHASFIYLVRWDYAGETFSSMASEDGGRLLGRWYNYQIRKAWPELSDQNREAVQLHRTGSYGNNPFDDERTFEDVDPFLNLQNNFAAK